MNVSLLKMLVWDDHRDVLAGVGYDKYAKLLEVSDQYLVVGDRLMKNSCVISLHQGVDLIFCKKVIQVDVMLVL